MYYCVQASMCSWDLNPDPHGYIGSISPSQGICYTWHPEIIKHGFPHKSLVGETDLLTVNVSVIMKHAKMFCFRLQGRLLGRGGPDLNLEEPV